MVNGELIIDSFAGGGGASTGIEIATGKSVDIAINHDPMAIAQHKANHPSTKHYCESVWDVNPKEACSGHPVALAWFSPDCKHFSKAKGGKPKDKNIRGLAWVALRWAALVRPRVIILENVEEFKDWGPLNRGHRPIKAKKGVTFRKFVIQLENLGYTVEHRELVAADYGAPTTRKRFFLIARCDGNPIVWPDPTHGPRDSEKVKAGILKPYVGAYTQIDFSLPCPSIFDSKEEIWEKYGIRAQRPLAEKTMKRIARGLQKFVFENPEPFIVPIGYGERKGQQPRVHDIQDPLPTVVGSCKHYLCAPTLIQYHSETASGEVRGQKLDEPVMTVDGSNRYGLVSAFIAKYYAGETRSDASDLSTPLHTVMARWGQSLCAAHLIQMNNHCDGRDITDPIPTITAGDGHFGEVRAFLRRYVPNESDRCIKGANRSRNNSCAQGREILEDIKQTESQKRNNSDRPKENGGQFEIGLPWRSCLERRKTISNASASSNVGDLCRGNTRQDGHQSQERKQKGQQVGKSGSCIKETELKSCDKNGAEDVQQLSGEILGESKGNEKRRNVVFGDSEGVGNISDNSISCGEFRAHTLIKYYGQGTGQSIKDPLDTITANDRFGLVTIQGVDYAIVDIGLRMLEPKELYGCQGFPDDYIIDRDYTGRLYPRSEQVKRCGNAVCPPIPAALVKANLPELCKAERMPNFRPEKIKEDNGGQLRFA